MSIGLVVIATLVVGGFYFTDDARPTTASTPEPTPQLAAGVDSRWPALTIPAEGFLQRPPVVARAGVAPTEAQPVPTPRQQGAAQKALVEGHWHGMELLDLTPALSRQYQLDPAQKGLLVDEVSLAAAEAGIRAGDVVRSIDGLRVANLSDVQDATFAVRRRQAVEIGLWRQGSYRTVVLRAGAGVGAVGFAMFEAASPIPPGAISPHKDRGRACTDCHIIMQSGGQLAVDAGDLLAQPPPITANARAPHGNRGPCATCHNIVPAAAKPPR